MLNRGECLKVGDLSEEWGRCFGMRFGGGFLAPPEIKSPTLLVTQIENLVQIFIKENQVAPRRNMAPRSQNANADGDRGPERGVG